MDFLYSKLVFMSLNYLCEFIFPVYFAFGHCTHCECVTKLPVTKLFSGDTFNSFQVRRPGIKR